MHPSQPVQSPSHVRRTVVRVLLGLAILAAAWQYQWIIDQYTLATYQAPQDIAALEQPLGLTRTAQAIADRARPQIDDKATFNKDCQTGSGELELGCYTGGRIYILKIDNRSLKSEMETVLAHELLHAAWIRASAGERQTLSSQLEGIYKGLRDEDLSQRMAGYAQSEPGEEANELHSILGTEQASLTPELEAHYLKYFMHRSVIVAAHAAYTRVFSTGRDQLSSQLATIKSLKGQLAGLDARMRGLQSAGQISQYNTLVPQQNQLVRQVNGLIDSYNQAVSEYNALSNSIDSHQLNTEPGV